MGRRFRILAALGLAALGQAHACCIASAGKPVWLTKEKVIIVWDAAKKVEHFIRQADFDTGAKDFGFIVPTPSVPDLAVADPAAFDKIEKLIPHPARFGCGKSEEDGAAAGGIEVLKEQTVGDYKATVVKATDGTAMNAWLKKNGYVSRPAMTEWLDGYAKQNWVFTALKYVAAPDTTTSTKALRISFKTDRPHYPYKMPKDTWPEGWQRPLSVYFIASGAVESKYVGTDDHWEAKEEAQFPLPDDVRAGLAKDMSLTDADLPKDATVTIFVNGHNASGYGRDLEFGLATNLTKFWIGGTLAVLVAAIMLRRRRRIQALPA